MLPPAFVDCYGDLSERLRPDMLALCPQLDVFRDEPHDEDELIQRLRGRRNALVYMGYLSGRVLRACPDLRTVAYLSTGLAIHADLEEAKRLGVLIEGVKGYGDRAVAEHAIALALAALKRIAESDRLVRAGAWHLVRTEEFAGRTFGVVGLGGIGRATAHIAAALGARVVGWTRSGDAGGSPVELMPLDQVLAEADILSLHLSVTPETERLLDEAAFARMKPGVVIVNTARAALVDEAAMLAAVVSGHVGHCALDVFHAEPLPHDSALATMGNVTLTPHSAWYTGDAIDRLLVAGLELLAHHIQATAP